MGCRNAYDYREGLPVTQRESATPATRQLLEMEQGLTHPHLAACEETGSGSLRASYRTNGSLQRPRGDHGGLHHLLDPF